MALNGSGRLRSRVAAAALALWAIVAAFGPSVADAQVLASHAEAGRAFDALRTLQPDRMPRLADVQGGMVLRTLGDAPRFVDAASFTPADLGALSDLCERDKAAIDAYTGFGAIQQGAIDAGRVVRNILEFQDELAVLQPFLARCIARQVPLAEAMLAQMSERQAAQLKLGGLKRSRTALLQLYAGASSCLSDARFGAAYCGLLEVLAELAPVHARALPLAARANAARMLPPPAQIPAGAQRDAVQRIVDALGGDGCKALCRVDSGT